MKKLLIPMTILLLILAACGGADEAEEQTEEQTEDQTLEVASLISPMLDILEIAKEQLAEEGIELEIVELSDNVQPNDALAHDEVDANFFQHVPYMEEYNRNNDTNLTPIQPIYYANYGVYAKDYDAMEEIPDGATLAVANDMTNLDRSLRLLDEHGVITLGETDNPHYRLSDIEENPHDFEFEEVDLLMLARAYDDVDAVLMTPAYAEPLGLTPADDALLTEGEDNDFAITLIAREDNEDSEAIQKLAEAMTSDEVRDFLEENYEETSIPAFD
ncbi:MetQ/NlpA family ABC transporter substrate-binding protein [Alkalibacillus haloalkaliphilus]|uniref:MetQ/NlpA family ABC transporter substrate-binding protein n=1 Tax=Alkalibacillus haloalkaliphilus TaxID=94136 RepID=UPI002935A4AD|nr:MetQ/NlpA family ABC transporter substrate-binding protein [Alkalibacillus haloalkaliphilus]MDV2581535.1 MetQ/NlpA family ABC transporter substrate-binding protein [Alkalibacillus haloalkaliphilus]